LEGYFIRGAIVKGNLFHDDKMVFGDALVSAYNLEQRVVRYPRIMVAQEVAEEASADEHFGQLVRQRLRQSSDGPLYVNTLLGLVDCLCKRNLGQIDTDASSLEMWQTIKGKIEERFDEATDVPRHFENVQWFANYWNSETDLIGGQIYMRINGPGLHPPPPHEDFTIR
jgi:hypothetical protein